MKQSMQRMRRQEYTPGYTDAGPISADKIVRTQVEVIRDVMLAAADCDTWLTLGEIAHLTRFGEASISAQLRHLRKPMFGGYRVQKRRRPGAGETMVIRQRRIPSGRGVALGAAGEDRVILPARPKRGERRDLWERAYGIRPGNWEYQVARF